MHFKIHSVAPKAFYQTKKFYLYLILGLFIICSLFVGFSLLGPKHNPIENFLISKLPDNLAKDKHGFINVLIAGSGGQNHIGGELTDAIIVASFNPKTQKVVMMSLPRDLHVQHPQIISQRINSIYENYYRKIGANKSMEIISQVASQVTGVEIPYYVKINFQFLQEIIDQLGGIQIYVPEMLYDPYYPGPNYSYQTFKLQKGLQKFNGATALKYARSRKTSSDFARSKRQQDIILAIKNKALKSKVLTNPKKLKALFNILQKNLITNLQMDDIITLALKGKNLGPQDLRNLVLSNDFSETGGFLYTPPREEYNQAFVLKPADSTYSQIHLYFLINRIYFDTMQYLGEIEIQNGTYISGLAGKLQQILKRFGIASSTANAEQRPVLETQLQHYDLVGTDTKTILKSILNINNFQKLKVTNPDLGIQTQILLGQDFVSKIDQLDSFSNYYDIIFQTEKDIPNMTTGSDPNSNLAQ